MKFERMETMVAREHPRQSFAACRTHFSAMMSDLLVDRGEDSVNVRVDRVRNVGHAPPTYFCSCRRLATFYVTTSLRKSGDGEVM